MNPLTVLVTGSRSRTDRTFIWSTLEEADPALVVAGGARGADTFARTWCERSGVTFVEVPALWGRYGKSAGARRNSEMLDIAISLARARETGLCCYAFPQGTARGTNDMIRRCLGAHVKVYTFGGSSA